MSKIEELIKEKCPDGVEYITLEEATNMQRGTSLTKAKAVEGNIPVISGGKEPAFYCNTANREEPVITVAGSGAGAGYVQYFDSPIFANDCFTLIGKVGVNTKYVYYFMESIQKKISETKKGAGVPHVHISDVDKFEIPVPPMEVQQEIVRILDKFAALEAELQVELDARKKQYECYRDKLLRRTTNYLTLGELAIKTCSGSTPNKSYPEFYEKGSVPWLRTQEVVYNEIWETECFITNYAVEKTSVKWIPENCVIVAISGASAGRCAINKIPLTTNQHCLNIQINPEKALYKYVFYCISNQIKELLEKKEGARGDLNSRRILSLSIPVPDLKMQARIVEKLDSFNIICNNNAKGLPAEIAARHKQYEYYRDKLLTFKRKVV